MGLFSKLFGSYSDRELKRIMPIAKAVEAKEEEYGRLSDEQLRHKTEELKERRILVRTCASFGLPDSWLRLAVRTEDENRRLIEELKQCLKL